VAALVTDGAVRDQAGILASGLSVWSRSIAAPPPMGGLTFINWGEPIGCGGVAIFPGDMLVADDDGAVAIPAALVELIAEQAPELERLEAWVMTQVEAGVPLPGLYPPNAETQARYAAFRAASSSSDHAELP
jgi:regulator of RNase E activity RraA